MVGLGPVDYRVQWVGVVFEWVVCPTLICWVAARAEMRRGMGMGCVLGLEPIDWVSIGGRPSPLSNWFRWCLCLLGLILLEFVGQWEDGGFGWFGS